MPETPACRRFHGGKFLALKAVILREEELARGGESPEPCRRLVEVARKISEVSAELVISQQTIYSWRRQARMEVDLEAGITTPERAELIAATRRVRETEAELATHRRATEIVERGTPQPGAKLTVVEKGGILYLVPERAIEEMRGIARGNSREGLRDRKDRHRAWSTRVAGSSTAPHDRRPISSRRTSKAPSRSSRA